MLVKFTILTHSGTSRTAVYECTDQAAIDERVEFYLSDTTGMTAAVTHTEYVPPSNRTPTGRISSCMPEIQSLPGTPTAKLEMAMARGLLDRCLLDPPAPMSGEEWPTPPKFVAPE